MGSLNIGNLSKLPDSFIMKIQFLKTGSRYLLQEYFIGLSKDFFLMWGLAHYSDFYEKCRAFYVLTLPTNGS